ncbi:MULTISPECIES: DUF4157 domain-containing protein [unclassified Mycolicibacterium]|uniref:eCIS core domain-containing protein n=1 Tax=unclassified Mycolicibacterium TaxID=2636767 RepID=UPI001F4BD779|nr:DUF4157 domain-containing protein [Mycolicibacterium sp. YH-1]UNB55798.1 DUF4157 domain-containing protein [Mycolicibacterium sp. YH-1]
MNEPGRPMDQASRAFFEPRFGRSFVDVRVHNDPAAARAARAFGAHAFTVGPHIAFAEGQYAPGTHSGNRLLAHELAHVAQGDSAGASSTIVRRDIAEVDLPQTPVTQIMADPNYFENGIARIEFYGAELARLIYTDNKQLDLGLVPGQIHAPLEAVDYRTARSVHVTVNQQGAVGSLEFVPRGTQVKTSGGASFVDVIAATSRKIRFTHDAGSGRIVPTELNSISAPRLCEALRGAEAEYVKNTDAIAKGMVHFLTVLNYSLMIYGFVQSIAGATSRAATVAEEAAGGGAAAAGVLSRAQSTLLALFIRLLRTGVAEDITVEGVGFSGVRATLRGTELLIERDAIVNVSRVAGQGRLVNAAFEQAAIAAARQVGAKTARVAFHTVVNAQWGAYLESLGYGYELIEGLVPGSIFTKVLTKVITL